MLKQEGLLEAELKHCIDEKYKFSAEIKAEATKSKWKRMWKHSTSDIRAGMVKRDDEWSVSKRQMGFSKTTCGVSISKNASSPACKTHIYYIFVFTWHVTERYKSTSEPIQFSQAASTESYERNWFWNI